MRRGRREHGGLACRRNRAGTARERGSASRATVGGGGGAGEGDGALGDFASKPTGGALLPPWVVGGELTGGNSPHGPSGVAPNRKSATSALGVVDNGWLGITVSVDTVGLDKAVILPMRRHGDERRTPCGKKSETA